MFHYTRTDGLGFEYDLPIDLTSEHWVTDEAINFVKDQVKNRPDKPFFLHASYFAPHHPYGPVKEFNIYDPDKMRLPPSWSEAGARAFRPETRKSFNLPPLTETEYKKIKAYYFGFITQLDFEIGRLLEWLDHNPEISNNTIVIFLSDHGDRMGEHGFLFKGGKKAMLEGSAGIPFMIRWPDVSPGTEKTPVTHIDIMPTVLQAAGLPPDADLPGSDLMSLLEERKSGKSWTDRAVFSEWFVPFPLGYIMVRKGNYKLIADNQEKTYPDVTYELYNTQKDKWEMNNLADDPAHDFVLKELQNEIWAHWERQKKFLPESMPPEVPRSRWNITLPYDPWRQVEPL